MTYTLIHYPSCGSSKKGLALLEERGVDVRQRKYMLKAERLSADELRDITTKLGEGPRAFLRVKDAERAGLSETASDDEVIEAMAADPKLIQRPIGINGDRAVVGRPNARLLDIL